MKNCSCANKVIGSATQKVGSSILRIPIFWANKMFYKIGPISLKQKVTSPLCLRNVVVVVDVVGGSTQCNNIQQHLLRLQRIVTRFGKILPLWQKFKSLWQFLTAYFLFGKVLNLLWQICEIVGLIFIFANGQMLKNNLTLWSHCPFASCVVVVVVVIVCAPTLTLESPNYRYFERNFDDHASSV